MDSAFSKVAPVRATAAAAEGDVPTAQMARDPVLDT